MENLALNKSVSASDVTFPYTPSRAVDGIINPFSRWQCNSVPCWLSVDLGSSSLVNRWVVCHMPAAGWPAPNYVNTDYIFQASNDNRTWIDIDSVTNNKSAITDRTIKPCIARYFRIYIVKGLKTTPHKASIVELEIYQSPKI